MPCSPQLAVWVECASGQLTWQWSAWLHACCGWKSAGRTGSHRACCAAVWPCCCWQLLGQGSLVLPGRFLGSCGEQPSPAPLQSLSTW